MSYGFQPPPYQGGGPGAPQPPHNPAFGGAPPPYGQPHNPNTGLFVIRNVSSGLCLDATTYDVKLQQYVGSPAQQWFFEAVGAGRNLIINRANGAALDIEGGPECGANLITYEKHGGINQQWAVNPDNTITSCAGDLAVDVCEGNCYPGNILIAYDRHGGPNQQFNLQYL